MNKQKVQQAKASRRKARTRAKISGTAARPRLNVYRSLKHLNVQVIDDTAGKTLVSANDSDVKSKGKPVEVAAELGKIVAEKAIKAGIKTVVFDRGSFQYHGRVKALADGAREGGLEF